MQVKVCGVRDRAGAEACAAAGVNYVGFNFVHGSRRSVHIEEAVELRTFLGESVVSVGLFRDSLRDEVEGVGTAVGVTWVQLHGDESPVLCGQLRRRFRVIKAVDIELARDTKRIQQYAGSIDLLLVDGKRPGTGTRWDWSALAECRRLLPGVPLFLAGGLHPWNVQKAIATARPDGVDTASGVERDRKQAPDLIEAFALNARGEAIPRPPHTSFAGEQAK
jgi:phosphoribosylanthranilate isomerase